MKNKFNPRKSKSLKRKINSRNTKKTFLILCEGEKTEPNYFKGFRVKTANIRVLGTGMNTESLVKECIKYKNSSEFSNKDEFWVVFDKDSFSNSLINKAFKLVENQIIL